VVWSDVILRDERAEYGKYSNPSMGFKIVDVSPDTPSNSARKRRFEARHTRKERFWKEHEDGRALDGAFSE
jgi:hypothetical protein